MITKDTAKHERSLNTETLNALKDWASPERAAEVLKSFADTPAPSQVAAWTRGPMIDRYLKEWNLDNVAWDANFKGTGNGVLYVGEQDSKPIWIVAHWDVISFLVGPKIDDGGYGLVPFHHHMMTEGSQPGLVLRYNLMEKDYEIICSGTIVGGTSASFRPDAPIQLQSGDRIVYHTPVRKLHDSTFSGQMDNAAGCTGALLAAAFLSRIPNVNVVVCFVDEEEGPVAQGNTAFARGSNRLLRYLPPPQLAVVVDLHTVAEGQENSHLGKGALIREHASRARGGVTPPWLYETVRQLASEYAPTIDLHENVHGGVSRSDCISLMQVTPNIVLCGPPSIGRHYADGPYICSASDIAHLARSLVMIARHFQ